MKRFRSTGEFIQAWTTCIYTVPGGTGVKTGRLQYKSYEVVLDMGHSSSMVWILVGLKVHG